MSRTLSTKERQLDEYEIISDITSALFESSAQNITELRDSFETNRLFYSDISELYRAVKRTAITRGHLSDKKPAALKGISVAFTSNTRFYGSINSEIMRTFLEHMKVTKRDCFVIGNTGRAFMENYPEEKKRSTFFSFENDQPNTREMRDFLKKVSVYDQVYVFYPSFINIFHQEVVVLDITHTPTLDDGGEHELVDYIFEPELPKMLAFFETRVRYLLFQRAMLESELARTASRLMAMSRAHERAEKAVTRAKRELKREVETFNDMRLLEALAGIKSLTAKEED